MYMYIITFLALKRAAREKDIPKLRECLKDIRKTDEAYHPKAKPSNNEEQVTEATSSTENGDSTSQSAVETAPSEVKERVETRASETKPTHKRNDVTLVRRKPLAVETIAQHLAFEISSAQKLIKLHKSRRKNNSDDLGSSARRDVIMTSDFNARLVYLQC